MVQTGRVSLSRMGAVSFGRPAAEVVAEEARTLGAHRVFLMVSNTLNNKTDEIDKVRVALGSLCSGTFDRMAPHTPRADVMAATKAAREAGADLIVTVGGGSITDGAKAVRLCLANDIDTPEGIAGLMEQWPASWAGFKVDEVPGSRLLDELRPFIRYLIAEGLSPKTVRRHLDNLWAIGGEVIRQFNDEPELRRRSARKLLLDVINSGEAPMLHHATQSEQRSADATARKLLQFLLTDAANSPSSNQFHP